METGNLLDILILFGAIQGFISAFLLFRKKKQITNYLLGSILIFTSLACLNMYLFKVLPPHLPFLFILLEKIIPLIIIMPLGPLIYFYVQTAYGIPFSFQKDKTHFVPVILDLVPSIISLVGIIYYFLGIHASIETAGLGIFKDAYDKYVDIPRWVSLAIYLVMAAKLFFSKHLRGKRTNWIRQFLIGFALFQLFWLFHLIPYLIPFSTSWLLGTLNWYPVYLPLTILVYWLGINGVIQSKSSSSFLLKDSEMEEIIHKLNQLMQVERLYLDSKLSLTLIVEKMEINQKKISSALNQYLGKSFNEYVNGFRVDEVKTRINDPKYDHLSITGIAFDCGFNSQATFQRSFKSITKMTPKAFQESVKKSIKNAHS